MALRDLIPWNEDRSMSVRRGGEDNPFLTLHREMNRLFDTMFRDLSFTPVGSGSMVNRMTGNWPSVELSETDQEIKVTAELPGLEEKDVEVQLANGMLAISGEKKTEIEDKDRLFNERYYGRFERRIPVEEVDQDKVSGFSCASPNKNRPARINANALRIPVNWALLALPTTSMSRVSPALSAGSPHFAVCFSLCRPSPRMHSSNAQKKRWGRPGLDLLPRICPNE
jgi:HSP20 family protein